MIAQVILSVLLCGILVYAWVEARRSPIIAALSLLAAVAGLYFVWFPAHSTRVAEFVGVGRGVDLILYLWVCISLILLLNLHLKLRTQHELITALARHIALATVQTREDPAAALEDRGHVMDASAPGRDEAAAHRSRQTSAHYA